MASSPTCRRRARPDCFQAAGYCTTLGNHGGNAMRSLALAACLALLAGPGHAAIVGSLDFVGDTIAAPVAFVDTFNSGLTVEDGLKFKIAPGQSGVVRLDILAGTNNIVLAAAAIETAFKVSATLPLSVFSDDLKQGVHKFAIS